MSSSLPNVVSGLLFQLYHLLFSPSCLMCGWSHTRAFTPHFPCSSEAFLNPWSRVHFPQSFFVPGASIALITLSKWVVAALSLLSLLKAATTSHLSLDIQLQKRFCSCEGKRPTFAKCLWQALREAHSWKTPTQSSWEQSLCNKTDLVSPHPLLFHRGAQRPMNDPPWPSFSLSVKW